MARANDFGLTHREEMARRAAERANRTPSGNHRFKIRYIKPTRSYVTERPTMVDGIRVRPNGLPRSRTYTYRGHR